MIRRAVAADVPEMLAIYAPYVRDTAISLEYDPPSPEAFARRFENITRRYPWFVWEHAGRVLGYAYADEAFTRPGYQWDADLSIYLARDALGHGAGHALYGRLEEEMRRLGYVNLYAQVTADNAVSCRFHERRGYRLLGVLEKSGFKFNRWYDVNWYGLRLTGDGPPAAPPEICRPDR